MRSVQHPRLFDLNTIPINRECTKCNEWKPFNKFRRKKKCRDGYMAMCKECERKYQADWVSKRKGYNAPWRKSFLKARYGISLEEYQSLFEKQNGVCAICGLPETSVNKGTVKCLAVDHCHQTGAIRGLLCNGCNKGIGLLKDSPIILSAARKYLEYYSSRQAA